MLSALLVGAQVTQTFSDTKMKGKGDSPRKEKNTSRDKPKERKPTLRRRPSYEVGLQFCGTLTS